MGVVYFSGNAFFFKKHQALPALVDVFNVAEWVFGILFLEARPWKAMDKMASASAVIWGTQNEGFQAILLWQNGCFLVRESPQEIPSIQF